MSRDIGMTPKPRQGPGSGRGSAAVAMIRQESGAGSAMLPARIWLPTSLRGRECQTVAGAGEAAVGAARAIRCVADLPSCGDRVERLGEWERQAVGRRVAVQPIQSA